MKKEIYKRTAQEKEKIILDVQRLGVVAGCRKYGVSRTMYYYWLEKYQSSGLDGLDDQRGKNRDSDVKRLEKEVRILKEIIAEKELELKIKDDLLKKKFGMSAKKEN